MRGSDLSPKSTEERYRDLYARFRKYHVDIQRMWKRLPPLAVGAYVGASFPSLPFNPPYEEPSGGTAGSDTYTGCPSRYAGTVYQLASNFPNQPVKDLTWTNIDFAAGSPDEQAATVTFPDPEGGNYSNYVYTRDHGFAIPLDVTIKSIAAYIRYRTPEEGASSDDGILATGYLLHVDGVVVNFASRIGNSGVGLGHQFVGVDWYDRLTLQSGISPLQPISRFSSLTPEMINSDGFGFGFYCQNTNRNEDLNLEIDAIRLEICWETEA